MSDHVPGIQVDVPLRSHRFFWTSLTRVYRQAEPQRREVCGVIDARAALRRVRKGNRGQVRLWVKPRELEAAVDAVARAA